jgi:hypothetical protein
MQRQKIPIEKNQNALCLYLESGLASLYFYLFTKKNYGIDKGAGAASLFLPR